MRKLRKVDRHAVKYDFSVQFTLSKVSVAVTGNRSDKDIGNNKMADFGVEDQKVKIEKLGTQMKANIFGITLNTYYSTSKLYSFGMHF